MSIENAVRNKAVLLEQVGKSTLNTKYPKEFELYLCALELINEDGKTLRYFVFPVMPSNLEETQGHITNIKKTLAGVTVLSTPTFVPIDISISGNFGRKFRILLGADYVDFISSFKTEDGKVTQDSVAKGIGQTFDERIKTGFGCCKILEDIVNESNKVDENGIRSLIFYNPAFGNSYLVKPMNLKFSQSQETNMIWSYSLQLKAIASLESLQTSAEIEDEAKRLNTTGYVQKQVDRVVSGLTSILK